MFIYLKQDNDIAIMTLARPVTTISPVAIPSSRDGTFEGETAIVLGWGRTDSSRKEIFNKLVYRLYIWKNIGK